MISDKAQEIIESRYLLPTEKTWEELARRVGYGIGGNAYGEKYTKIISEQMFIPGGRINRNVGRERGSLFNCYCLPIGDSLREIGELYSHALNLWGQGGGVGINFSTLRPKGSTIRVDDGTSSGMVSFMRSVDGIAATIESGGQRRAASLGLCEVWHPEVEDFIRSKQKDGDISYFNISVGVNEKFIDTVRKGEQWKLHFNNLYQRSVGAKKIWSQIIKGMIKNGEPGLINMSNLTTNNSYYFAPIRGTNPCGEACLEDYGVCNLGSLVLPKFVSGKRMNWKKLEEVIRLAIRFLDTAIDINRYSLQQIKQTATRGRRIGLGVMGLADLLFATNIRYGSRNAIDFIERLFKFIRNISYEESCNLGQEKGTFPAFDSNLYCKAKFIRGLPPSIRRDIRKFGTRNVTCLAVAPTGTISLVPEVSSSIEPLMYKGYERRDRVSTRRYIHPLYKSFYRTKSDASEESLIFEVPDWFVDSTEITPQEHIDTQIAVQKYIDGAVSKTILLPKDFKQKQLSELLLESIDDLKGITVYKEGSRNNAPVQRLTNSQIMVEIGNEGSNERQFVPQLCSTGSCDV